ncbi:DUF2231 domain-containing protein [Actinoallomurus sp. NPDC052308]|uniref:DUF2231 domain-containing protein n=1 Tax=Actinoallomurus sp. NPDC052308 TaxID=3155530 RepID=UPI0034321C61
MTTALTGSDSPAKPPTRRFFSSDPSVILLAATVVVAVAVAPFELSKLFGLPAHALFLHVPVVLVPILAGVVIALAVRPVWRVRYGLAAGVFGIVTMAATILTAGAGEKLRDERMQRMGRLRPGGAPAGGPGGRPGSAPRQGGGGEGNLLDRHAELGSQLRLLVLALVVLLVVLVILARYRALTAAEGFLAGPALGTVVAALAVVAAVVSAIWVVRTGHLGAEMTWHEGD